MIILGNMPPKRVFTSTQVRECILNESGQNSSDDSSPDTDDSESDDENNLCIGRPVRNTRGAGFRVCGGGVRTCGGGVRTRGGGVRTRRGGIRIHEAGGGATAHGGERELSGDEQEGNFDANAPNEMIEQNDAENNEEENGHDEQNEGGMEPQGWVAVDNQTERHIPMTFDFSGDGGIMIDTTDFDALDYYKQYLTDDLLNSFVAETNRYAQSWIQGHSLRRHSRAQKWRDVTFDEMKVFIGLTLLMGLVKLPRLDLYWTKDSLFHVPLFKAVMDRDRYILILKFWHIADNDTAVPRGQPGYDSLHKIRPLLQHLNEKFQAVYTPSQNIAIDESLVLWKGRLVFRQYIPMKRARFGIKHFMLCENTGYTYRFDVYTGAQDEYALLHNQIPLPDSAAHLPKPGKVIVSLLTGLMDKGYSLSIDNWYSSIPLYTYLHQRGTNVCGTIKKNMVPKDIRNTPCPKGEQRPF